MFVENKFTLLVQLVVQWPAFLVRFLTIKFGSTNFPSLHLWNQTANKYKRNKQTQNNNNRKAPFHSISFFKHNNASSTHHSQNEVDLFSSPQHLGCCNGKQRCWRMCYHRSHWWSHLNNLLSLPTLPFWLHHYPDDCGRFNHFSWYHRVGSRRQKHTRWHSSMPSFLGQRYCQHSSSNCSSSSNFHVRDFNCNWTGKAARKHKLLSLSPHKLSQRIRIPHLNCISRRVKLSLALTLTLSLDHKHSFCACPSLDFVDNHIIKCRCGHSTSSPRPGWTCNGCCTGDLSQDQDVWCWTPRFRKTTLIQTLVYGMHVAHLSVMVIGVPMVLGMVYQDKAFQSERLAMFPFMSWPSHHTAVILLWRFIVLWRYHGGKWVWIGMDSQDFDNSDRAYSMVFYCSSFFH